MNTSQTVYLRAAIMALGLAILFYFIAPATTTDIGLAAAAAALISGLLTPLVIRGTCCSTPSPSDVVSPQKKSVSVKKEEQVSAAATTSTFAPVTDAKTLYVGNLPYRANEAAIRKLFSQYGTVISVRLVKDKETGKRRGYGFVEMPEQEARAAVAALNETEYLQRTLKVREANDKKESNDTVEGEA